MEKLPVLAIVIPCYNEEESLDDAMSKLSSVMLKLVELEKIGKGSFLCFVDDRSLDGTWSKIKGLSKNNKNVKGLRLSKNGGHQTAMLAGLMFVRDKVDCAISIDADLQQDEGKIPEFVEKHINGADIVFGVRRDRSADTFMKKVTALSFYKIMEWMSMPIIKQHADYRLVSKKILYVIAEYKEVNLYLRGIFAGLGCQVDYVEYDHGEREHGETKYTYKKMLRLALDGLTSFSIVPLRLVTATGFIVFLLSMVMIIVALTSKIMPTTMGTIKGWSSTIVSLYFLGGIQIMALGIIGEYIGKIYQEVKRRPRYFIDEEVG